MLTVHRIPRGFNRGFRNEMAAGEHAAISAQRAPGQKDNRRYNWSSYCSKTTRTSWPRVRTPVFRNKLCMIALT